MNFFQRVDQFVRRQASWIGIAGWILAALLSTYLFFLDKPRGIVAYGDTNVQIYDSQASRDALALVTPDGERIEDNVFAVEIVIANVGDISLSSDRKRKPLTIGFENEAQIIDALVTASADPEISSFELRRVAPDTNVFELQWDFFDPGQSVKLTMIVAANDISSPIVRGKYLGIEFISAPISKPPDPGRLLRLATRLGFAALTLVSFFIFLIGGLFVFEKLTPNWSQEQQASVFFRGLGFLVLFSLAAAIIYGIFFSVKIPHM